MPTGAFEAIVLVSFNLLITAYIVMDIENLARRGKSTESHKAGIATLDEINSQKGAEFPKRWKN